MPEPPSAPKDPKVAKQKTPMKPSPLKSNILKNSQPIENSAPLKKREEKSNLKLFGQKPKVEEKEAVPEKPKVLTNTFKPPQPASTGGLVNKLQGNQNLAKKPVISVNS